MFNITILGSLAWSVVPLTAFRGIAMANGREKLRLACRWRRAAAIAIAIIGAGAIAKYRGRFVLAVNESVAR